MLLHFLNLFIHIPIVLLHFLNLFRFLVQAGEAAYMQLAEVGGHQLEQQRPDSFLIGLKKYSLVWPSVFEGVFYSVHYKHHKKKKKGDSSPLLSAPLVSGSTGISRARLVYLRASFSFCLWL